MSAELFRRVKPLLDAGLDLAKLNPAKAEAIVRDLVEKGQLRSHEAAQVAQVLVERGREAAERAGERARGELARQLDRLLQRVEGLERQVTELQQRVGRVLPTKPRSQSSTVKQTNTQASATTTSSAPKKAVPKKAVPKKAVPKKAVPKKAVPKKAVPKKQGTASS